jgi:hypothetical protein
VDFPDVIIWCSEIPENGEKVKKQYKYASLKESANQFINYKHIQTFIIPLIYEFSYFIFIDAS